ncbi:DUF3618 domain-containing protein [Streptomyces sp. NPDC002773]|uniref:DUF3618 domain-containing protein n=1 Tax=Streptomyces sp. NPDC002773 TaxID=3154430 RepID=UPI0033226E92
MSTPSKDGKDAAPTPEELREQVEHARDELGQTVEALAAKADVKAQAKEKATLVGDQLREKAAHAAQLVKNKTPDPVLDKAAHAAAQVRETATRAGQLAAEKTPDPVREKAESAATMAKANRTPLVAAAVAFVVFLLLRRSQRCR